MYKELVKAAMDARKNAYCPYSGFAVGAALLTIDGDIYTGCNVENAAGISNCAERTAVCKAVSQGVTEFEAIAIVGGIKNIPEIKNYCYPCGVCRQILSEFCSGDFKIISGKNVDDFEVHTLAEILPFSFELESNTPRE